MVDEHTARGRTLIAKFVNTCGFHDSLDDAGADITIVQDVAVERYERGCSGEANALRRTCTRLAWAILGRGPVCDVALPAPAQTIPESIRPLAERIRLGREAIRRLGEQNGWDDDRDYASYDIATAAEIAERLLDAHREDAHDAILRTINRLAWALEGHGPVLRPVNPTEESA